MSTFFEILKQQAKKNFRVSGFYNNLAINIIMGIVALYFAGILFLSGFFSDKIFLEIMPEQPAYSVFNGVLFYLLLLGLIIRVCFQNLNVLNLQTYQILPIKRSTLVNTLFINTFVNPLNYLLLFYIVPFAFRAVSPEIGVVGALTFIFSFLLLIWSNSFLAAYIKRLFGGKIWAVLIPLLLTAFLVAAEFLELFSLFFISQKIFIFILLNPYAVLLLVLFLGAVYGLNRHYFSRHYYVGNFEKKVKKEKIQTLSFLERYGMIGEIIGLELKLIFRHKRTKSILYMCLFFLFYELFMFKMESLTSFGWLFFMAIFEVGLLMLMFGQWTISWDSPHFDSLMSNNIPVNTYITANLRLLQLFNVVCFIVTSPYFFLGKEIFFMHTTAFFYNIGVSSYLLVYFATYNTKRINLGNSSAFNYQGTTFKNFLIMLPIMFFPLFASIILEIFFSYQTLYFIFAGMGLFGILLDKPLIKLCVKKFNSRKYLIAEGFREKN